MVESGAQIPIQIYRYDHSNESFVPASRYSIQGRALNLPAGDVSTTDDEGRCVVSFGSWDSDVDSSQVVIEWLRGEGNTPLLATLTAGEYVKAPIIFEIDEYDY